MADISKITLPSGNTYDIKDTTARTDIATLKTSVTGAMHYAGVTTTAISDGATTNPIKINNADYTAKNGDVVIYSTREYVFSTSDNKWHEFGSTGSLKALAFKDSASGKFTPSGSVSQPTFTGSDTTSTGKFTPSGSVGLTTTNKTATVSKASSGTATYTPEGTNSGCAVALNTTTVNSITAVGTLPSFTATVSNENLTLGFSQGTLPTKGSDTTVATGVKSVTQPKFTGTGARLVTGNIAVPTSASFTGTEGDVSVSGTPSGTVSKPTFTGSAGTVSVS